MTSLIAWIGVDSRGPASIYLASDSRISWGGKQSWDYGRKLFTFKNHSDIIGYLGDVLFPSQVLSQLADLAASGLLFTIDDSPKNKWEKITVIIKRSFRGYPFEKSHPFTIVHCTRENSRMESVFHISTLSWEVAKGWTNTQSINLPNQSGLIDIFGSGVKSVSKWFSYWSRTKEKRTSRSVFSAFCDALRSGEDRLSGGAPQLVGIYREGTGETFGIIYNDTRYLFGLPVEPSESLNAVEWRNSLFERCDWKTMEPLRDAQRHSRPRGLGKDRVS